MKHAIAFYANASSGGHDVILRRDEEGGLIAVCPTPGCAGSHSEWVRSGNPLTSQEAWTEWERILDEVDREASAPNPTATPVFKPL